MFVFLIQIRIEIFGGVPDGVFVVGNFRVPVCRAVSLIPHIIVLVDDENAVTPMRGIVVAARCESCRADGIVIALNENEFVRFYSESRREKGVF